LLLLMTGFGWAQASISLDCQVAEQEDREAYQALLQRLYERGPEEVPLTVADGCGSVRAAVEIV
jgi:transposase-like protein